MNTSDLPDLLRSSDGSPVASPADWARRRREVANAVIDLQYGGLPPAPREVVVDLLHAHEVVWLDGLQHASYRVSIDRERSFGFVLDLVLPPGDGPFPVVLNGDACWLYASDEVRAEVIRRGYGLARFNRCEIVPDAGSADRSVGLYRLHPGLTFGALAAWAWGYHRAVDALLKIEKVDGSKIAIVGHSRGGKTTLLAGATDERIALVGTNESGCGGAGCYRITGEGAETLEHILTHFGYWFGPCLREYIGRENELPFDQHYMKALVAPRPLLCSESADDLWANPLGTRATHDAARAVYKLLGAEDAIGITYRKGPHAHAKEDWVTLLDFVDWRFKGIKPTSSFDSMLF
jgi:hypothetical protein